MKLKEIINLLFNQFSFLILQYYLKLNYNLYLNIPTKFISILKSVEIFLYSPLFI